MMDDDEPEFPTEEQLRLRVVAAIEKRRGRTPSATSLLLADELDYAADTVDPEGQR